MTELKVVCDCGQKYKFDVEPVNNQMPFTVNCPICKRDGTPKANALLQQMTVFKMVEPGATAVAVAPPPLAAAPAPIAPIVPPAAAPRMRINMPAMVSPAPVAHLVTSTTPAATRTIGKAPKGKSAGEFNLPLGILGAFIGAAVGVGMMYGFYEWAGFRFPLLGVGIGVLTGLGARILSRGTENTLGFISGGIALAGVVGTLFLMYGDFPLISIISVAVSVSMAYRISSG